MELSNIIKNFDQKKVLVIGDAILDVYYYGKAVCLSLDTPSVEAEESDLSFTFFGGAGIAVTNILSLGGSVDFFSIVGNDEAAKHYDSLKDPKLYKNLIVDKHRKTTVKKRYWIDDYKILQLNRVTNEDISSDLVKKIIDGVEERIKDVDIVCILDSQHGMMTKTLISQVIDLSKKQNKPVYVDTQISHRDDNSMFYSGVDCLFLNLKEAQAFDPYFTLKEPEKSLRRIKKKLNLNNFIVKLSGKGILAIFNDKFIESEPYRVEAVDACGAGNSFMAAFSLGDRDKPEESLYISNIWAALSTKTHGISPPEKQELINVAKVYEQSHISVRVQPKRSK